MVAALPWKGKAVPGQAKQSSQNQQMGREQLPCPQQGGLAGRVSPESSADNCVGISLLLPAFRGILSMGWARQGTSTPPRPCQVEAPRKVQCELLRARTSSLETELISAARDSEKEAENRFLAPWMLRLMICPLSSSFCSFRFLLSCSHTQTTHCWSSWCSELIQNSKGRQGLSP